MRRLIAISSAALALLSLGAAADQYTAAAGSAPQLVAPDAPVRGVVEPDADGDGYGDETQDGCPQSAAHQAACPVVSLTTRGTVRKKAILVLVQVSSEALVKVYGQVSWQVRQPKSRGGGNRGLIVGLSGGRQRTVRPGTTASFRVRLPKTVKRRLGRLTKRQALRPKLTVVATDLAGRISSRVFRVRLPGYRPVQ